jgi:hypothetical protein
MIVGQNDPGTAVLGGIGDNRTKRKVRVILVALMAAQVQASRLIVDVRDPEALPPRFRLTETAAKERLGGCKPIELQRVFGTLIPHAR